MLLSYIVVLEILLRLEETLGLYVPVLGWYQNYTKSIQETFRIITITFRHLEVLLE